MTGKADGKSMGTFGGFFIEFSWWSNVFFFFLMGFYGGFMVVLCGFMWFYGGFLEFYGILWDLASGKC